VGRERRDTVHETRDKREEKAKRVSACVSPPEFDSDEIDVSHGWAGIISETKQKRKGRVNGTAARNGDPDNAEIDMLHSMMREEKNSFPRRTNETRENRESGLTNLEDGIPMITPRSGRN